MNMLRRLLIPTCATFVCTALLTAQDVQYKSVTAADFGGPLGGLMKLAMKGEGSGGKIEQTSYLKGRKMRHDGAKASTIIDLDAGKMIMLDHGKKQYSELTFAEMQAMMARAVPQAKEEVKGVEGIETKIDVKVDATGEKKTINGATAQRHFVTTTMTFVVTEDEGKGEKKKSDEGNDGALVMVNDMWLTKDGTFMALHKANQAWAEAMGQGGERSMLMIFAQYPKAREAFKRMAEETKKLDGAPARSAFYFVSVPEGKTFDRDKLIAETEAKAAAAGSEPEKKKGGGLGGFLKSAAKASMEAGSGQKNEKPAEQAMLFYSLTDIVDVKATSLEPSLFAPPADYKQVNRK